MFWFGEKTNTDFNWQDDVLWEKLLMKRKDINRIKIDLILDLLDDFSKESFDDSLPFLIKESGFSEDETKKTLALLPEILRRENLEKRIKAELNQLEVLDQFVKLPHGSTKVKAISHGLILHVTAGNVFLSSIDSLIMGFLTKNLSVLKVSSQNKFFPLFFAMKLKSFDKHHLLADKFAILHWKGGDERAEKFIKQKVDAIIAWGGEEMINSYRKDLPSRVKLLDFGPKISIQLISAKGLHHKDLKVVAEKIVADITPWDQSACASPQNLYLEEGIPEEELMSALNEAFLKAPPRGSISEDEATEILKEKYRGFFSELMEDGRMISGPQHLIHFEQNKILKSSPLHRSLIVKKYRSLEELARILEPFSYYLQSCSYLLDDEEKSDYLNEISLVGVKRFAPLGTVTWGMAGAPHDGRFVLKELVSFIGDEFRAQNYGESFSELQNSKELKSQFENSPHPKGYIFSSGGTTGEPKFVHFSYEEFDYMTDMLAENFKSQGLKPGMMVANLFVAGNLWSSFLAVEKALEKVGAVQLPIGGMCSQENVFLYLKKFRPHVVMGIPSMLLMTAEFMAKKQENVHIPMVFYAGEALSDVRRDYISAVWGTSYFGSAGYASVDAGVIGYQCRYCAPGEHHVFSDFVEMDIIQDEIIISSVARNSLIIKNYQTGDRAQWIENCECKSQDRRFKLLGRLDNIIQIWSCRLLLSDIEKCMTKAQVLTFQIRIIESKEKDVVREKLVIVFESHGQVVDEEILLETIYHSSRDLRDTLSFEDFKSNTSFEAHQADSIPRNPRTGKISLVVDKRS
jgi:phenylacetate-coenzyme A ligase PaaK-like adenylate-forming protein